MIKKELVDIIDRYKETEKFLNTLLINYILVKSNAIDLCKHCKYLKDDCKLNTCTLISTFIRDILPDYFYFTIKYGNIDIMDFISFSRYIKSLILKYKQLYGNIKSEIVLIKKLGNIPLSSIMDIINLDYGVYNYTTNKMLDTTSYTEKMREFDKLTLYIIDDLID